ncbi:hypothetical protein [Thermus phage P23-45]|uniref:Deoxycytidine triphosphate deaminase n=1 Tax=Thermus virus P23-45 TaxID=2914006 RepID=A7XX56_BP234|nr:dCTP deaminase [Thermus phage P23-45]ABU96865.1 deoxycytidine triphosphate deaminase [Thermus phage P23-45]UYB98442.1 hypothetical protein [Thermus phage P23-45]
MILPDWFWHTFGKRLVSPFNPERIGPTSYDLALDRHVILQVYQGKALGARGVLDGDRILLEDGTVLENRFLPGDSVLAHTCEYLRVPRFIRLQGMLKSSVARAGLNHRTALYVDPGFHGTLTLELEFGVPGRLVPFKPIIQVEAQLCFPLRPYQGRYVGQHRPEPSRNPDIAFLPE